MKSAMKPIPFTDEMVRAILLGRKTKTRRVLKLPAWSTGQWEDFELDDNGQPMIICEKTGCLAQIKCPYGQPDDLLWVRETWGIWDVSQSGPLYSYRADGGLSFKPLKWRSSRFMPYDASRITLKNLGVRVERLQDITEADAIAEGIDHNWWLGEDCPPEYLNEWQNYLALTEDDPPCYNPIDSFKTLWDSINRKRGFGWDTNPMVWAIEFKQKGNL